MLVDGVGFAEAGAVVEEEVDGGSGGREAAGPPVVGVGGVGSAFGEEEAVEDWRADVGDFPAAVFGSEMEGWADERWLDIRRTDLLEPIMRRRIETCAEKGFDAVDPDNMNG